MKRMQLVVLLCVALVLPFGCGKRQQKAPPLTELQARTLATELTNEALTGKATSEVAGEPIRTIPFSRGAWDVTKTKDKWVAVIKADQGTIRVEFELDGSSPKVAFIR